MEVTDRQDGVEGFRPLAWMMMTRVDSWGHFARAKGIRFLRLVLAEAGGNPPHPLAFHAK